LSPVMEMAMHDFEVRVLNDDGRPTVILAGPHRSVIEALRVARGVAVAGNLIEVWRGHDRVHEEALNGN
jgi:hypothetical protein